MGWQSRAYAYTFVRVRLWVSTRLVDLVVPVRLLAAVVGPLAVREEGRDGDGGVDLYPRLSGQGSSPGDGTGPCGIFALCTTFELHLRSHDTRGHWTYKSQLN